MKDHVVGSVLMFVLLLGAPGAFASDGVIEINHFIALAGGVNGDLALDPPGYPVTITQSGSYLVTGHMTVPSAGTSGIVVTALRTTIDFGGFELRGPNQKPTRDSECTASGIGDGVMSTQSVTVRNGRISGMGNGGLVLGPNSRVESMVVTQNCGFGVLTQAASIVFDTQAFLNSAGIRVGSASRVRDSIADRNSDHGIFTDANSVVSSCVSTNNSQTGIVVDTGSLVIQNVSANNAGFGISTRSGARSSILHNVLSSNGFLAIDSEQSDGVGGNTLNLNGGGGGITAGVALQCNAINGVASCP